MWMSLRLFVASCVDSFVCMSLRMYDPSECMCPLCICPLWYVVHVYVALCVGRSECIN